MSAQAGLFHFDERPVPQEVVDRLGAALDPYGPDRAGQFLRPGLAMLHRAWDVTPEDAVSRQPYVSVRGNVTTWDGRLDNRDDLLLQFWHEALPETSDAALATMAYEKWGEAGFGKLIGDWSLVIWNAEQQAIVLASDFMGIRPLHYVALPDSVSWSTTIESLVHLHGLYDDLDPYYLVRILTSSGSSLATPYRRIVAVPTAHAVTFRRTGPPTRTRFWDLGATQIRYRDERDYATHLRDLFVETVRNRLRCRVPVWAHLSGGLDSSAIVCAADALIKQGRAVTPDLHTLSFYSDSSPAADERRFIACVEEQRGRASHLLLQDHTVDRIDPERHWITPAQPRHASIHSFNVIREQGGRVLLTGEAGDTVMANYLYYHHDVALLLRERRPIAALNLARERALANKGTIWERLYQASMELLPFRLQSRWMLSCLLESNGGPARATDQHVAETFFLNRAFAQWWREDALDLCTKVLAFRDVSHRPSVLDILSLTEHRRAQSPSDVLAPRLSHPYLDRRIVEFMLGIPIGISAPPGKPRELMRQAFGPFMPARVVNRISKSAAGSFYLRNTRDIILRWLERPDEVRVLQLEFVDRPLVLRHLATLRDGHGQPSTFMKLLRMEHWLEAREQHLRHLPSRIAPETSGLAEAHHDRGRDTSPHGRR